MLLLKNRPNNRLAWAFQELFALNITICMIPILKKKR